MQFPVPQNISMEDRIVGPLNPTQFTIMVIGGAIAFFTFQSTVLPDLIAKALGGGFALLTLVLAVGKFNDQPMYRFFKYIIAFIISPKTRIWHKAGTQPPLINPKPQVIAEKEKSAAKHISKDDIASLALVLDTHGKEGIVPTQPNQPKP